MVLRLAALCFAAASTFFASVRPPAPQGQEPKLFTHKDHVDRIWFNPDVREVWRDCRGCHVFSKQQEASAPQQLCDDCHGVGNLGKQFLPQWTKDLSGYRTRTRDAFRHHKHGMLECRECHLPAQQRFLTNFDIVTGPGQCQRCHEEGAAAANDFALLRNWRVFEGAADPEVAANLGIAPWKAPSADAYAAYAKTLAEAFAGLKGGINTTPLPPGGAFDHYDHGDLACTDCHVNISKASPYEVGTGRIPSEGCAKCHRTATGGARVAAAPPPDKSPVRALWSLGAFVHSDHYRFLAPGASARDPVVATAEAYAQLRDAKEPTCRACHTFDESARGLPAPDYPFEPGKSRHRYQDCAGCHAVPGWTTGELAQGTGRQAPLHDSVAGVIDDGKNGWSECARCHDFAARDFASARPKVEVRRIGGAVFEFGVHTHPDITKNGVPPSGRGPLGDCKQCHRAKVAELPSRLERRPFRHQSHLAANADAAACRECHPRAGDALDASSLALADGRTYTLDSCSKCHLGSRVREVGDVAAAPREVVAFPHGPHAAKAACNACHDLAGDGADVTTKTDALSCVRCHDHKAATEGPATERLFDGEVQSCARCHHEDAAGGAAALAIPPVRGSAQAATDRRYNTQQSVFAGFLDNQFHPLGGKCTDCHKAVPLVPGTEANMAGLKRKREDHLAATYVSPHAKDVGGKQPPECLRCHWKVHESGAYADGVRGTPEQIRLRSSPSSPETRKALGNAFEGYPGKAKAKG